MRKVKKKTVERTTQGESVPLGLAGMVRLGLRESIFAEGMRAVMEMLEAERTAICGPRYGQGPERKAHRAGHADGELVLGGRLVSVRRPRVRDNEGEVALPS